MAPNPVRIRQRTLKQDRNRDGTDLNRQRDRDENRLCGNRPIRVYSTIVQFGWLRLGVTYEKGVTLGNVTMSHRTRERPAECLASLSHSTMIGLPRAQH
ncbi:hypothetical protein EVAR_41293_1 [Eumeta japonica]|uniref:Uncharacterized protein n=1 Tax=Eumeta variegata TaxID=151549 RepID=A0A4C1X890_EUMVA|nr:hypothetical protein EVAR_41293_1 [Eumeta japonica]